MVGAATLAFCLALTCSKLQAALPDSLLRVSRWHHGMSSSKLLPPVHAAGMRRDSCLT